MSSSVALHADMGIDLVQTSPCTPQARIQAVALRSGYRLSDDCMQRETYRRPTFPVFEGRAARVIMCDAYGIGSCGEVYCSVHAVQNLGRRNPWRNLGSSRDVKLLYLENLSSSSRSIVPSPKSGASNTYSMVQPRPRSCRPRPIRTLSTCTTYARYA